MRPPVIRECCSFQCYPTFRRFDCKVFLTEALRYFGGAAARTMIDNTHVVVLRGSGRDMVPVPEMAAFGERFGFQFVAHAIGQCQPFGTGGAPLISLVIGYAQLVVESWPRR